MPFTTSRSARIWYEAYGRGPSIVLIHGGLLEPMDANRFWVATGIVDSLVRSGFRVIIYDRRFSGGKTVAPMGVHSWDIEAADISAVTTATNDRRVHIIAGSNGVSAAIRFATVYPNRVCSLTLCWPTPPDNEPLHDGFQEAHSLVATHGTSAYIDAVRGPSGDVNQWLPFQHVLVQKDAVTERFRCTAPNDAANIFTRCDELLLTSDVLRGVSSEDLEALGQAGIPAVVFPADPEDRFHTREIACELASRIACAKLVSGTLVSLSPLFPQFLDVFTARVVEHLRSS